MQEFDYIRLVYLSILGLAVAGLIYTQFVGRMVEAIKTGITWVFIFLGVIASYGLWEDFRSAALPTNLVNQTDSQITLRRNIDGHFYALLSVNGHNTLFLIDTGATEINLTRTDAISAGFDPDMLNYNVPTSTANGIMNVAPVRIEELRFNDLVNRQVRAYVSSGESNVSLLGQSYLDQFNKVIIDGEYLTLQYN